MKLKYRIKKYSYPSAPSMYVAQYKVFGIWMNMGNNRGHITKLSASTQCETLDEARNKIKCYKNIMKRGSEIMYEYKSIIKE